MEKSVKTRIESDLLGLREVLEEVLYGVQILRALENFPISNFKQIESTRLNPVTLRSRMPSSA